MARLLNGIDISRSDSDTVDVTDEAIVASLSGLLVNGPWMENILSCLEKTFMALFLFHAWWDFF